MNVLNVLSLMVFPAFVVGIVLYGLIKKINVYQAFIEGAKSGIGLSFKVLPYMVAMIFAVEVFSASGVFEWVTSKAGDFFSMVGIPAEVIPITFMRPFSGGASLGLLAGIFQKYGTDTYIGRVASTYMGSSETLFYTVSLYFGSVGVEKTRYVVPVALLTDLLGIFASCILCKLMFG